MLNLITEIDKYLMEKSSRERKGHYPSDILACVRQLWYKWKNIPQSDPPTPGSLLKMEMGNIVHQWVYHVLKKRGFKLIVENDDFDGEAKSFYDSLLLSPFRYKTDANFTDPDGVKSIIEVKSSYGKGIKEVKLNGPRDDHFAQGLLYMVFEKIQRVYFIFLGRDNGYRTQHMLEADIIDDLFSSDDFFLDSIRIDRTFVKNNPRYKMILDGQKINITYDNMVAKLQGVEQWISEEILPPRDYKAAIKKHVMRNSATQKALTHNPISNPAPSYWV